MTESEHDNFNAEAVCNMTKMAIKVASESIAENCINGLTTIIQDKAKIGIFEYDGELNFEAALVDYNFKGNLKIAHRALKIIKEYFDERGFDFTVDVNEMDEYGDGTKIVVRWE